MHSSWVEWLGYLASLIVLLSLLMSSLIRLRWINLLGATLFTIYGLLIGAFPVALVNFVIALIDIYYLAVHYTTRDRFGLVAADARSPLFGYLVDSYREEIEEQTPLEALERSNRVFYLMRNSEVAGIFAGRQEGEELTILLDYVIPRYRDFKQARYLYIEHSELFLKWGVHRLRSCIRAEGFDAYFRDMGFESIGEGCWEKKL